MRASPADSPQVPGNDATFVVDQFTAFMDKALAQNRPFYAHLTFHAIHEPHPAMPRFYHQYANDPDYLGALTMFDDELGRLIEVCIPAFASPRARLPFHCLFPFVPFSSTVVALLRLVLSHADLCPVPTVIRH